MNKDGLLRLVNRINETKEKVVIMEVCGTHTNAIGKFGLRNILNSKIKLISGPGCPVCVTPAYYIDYVYRLAIEKKVIPITYGDMLRVPGKNPNITLEGVRREGGRVEILYSAMDAIKIAEEEKDKNFLFLGIGFETTAPSTCILAKEIKNKKVDNLHILSMHKAVKPVLERLISNKEVKVDGFILPGNVAVITGEEDFRFIEESNCNGIITGFDCEDILTTILKLCDYKEKRRIGILENNYKTFVKDEGNKLALGLIHEVFTREDTSWRGLGEIEESGLAFREEYRNIDILNQYPMEEIFCGEDYKKENKGCRCGEILQGKISPKECSNFGKVCNPSFPIGPCMVSSEGTCASYYKYQ